MGDAGSAFRALAALPYERWAVRLKSGTVSITGLVQEFSSSVGSHDVQVGPGPVALELVFLGGPRPVLAAATIDGDLVVDGVPTTRLRVVGGVVHRGDDALPTSGALGTGRLVTDLIDHTGDVAIVARALPDGDAVARLPEGFLVGLSGDEEIVVRARTCGPAQALVLAEPLDLQFGTRGVQLDHQGARWLARLARVRIGTARLHPDGRVDLHGPAPTSAFDGVLRGGLSVASAHLSGLVRRSPRFRKVRDFLM